MFETTIRVLGGLLSAHQFAIDTLPSLPTTYQPPFEYHSELLHLAEDLGLRLLPALTESPTGIPYPRINLRHGLPHGVKNPNYYNRDRSTTPYRFDKAEHDSERFWKHARTVRKERPEEEVTETCTAGAGSLVLEFTTLSRLTANPVFETAAKRAFQAIWSRRSTIGLLGTGINSESGLWEGAHSGIGAGADSFYEYAFKSYIFLAGDGDKDGFDESYFLEVWEQSREALERHVMVTEPATWWNNVHIATGAGIPGAQWIDSLGAFWSGTLAGAGSVPSDGGDGEDGLEVGMRSNMVYTALWTRYAALPERYNTRLSTIDSGLSWYPGRPEFIESTYLLYRATKDPFYLHVGEMVMQDLKRRCKTKCGWAGLQDVRSGEQQDRMESFWLSETWTYLFLLFDEGTPPCACPGTPLMATGHPLHKSDAAWVFTTEGHPLILPRPLRRPAPSSPPARTCLAPHLPTSIFSAAVARADFFHPAFFTRLHLVPTSTLETSDAEIFTAHQSWSPTNSTYYPWTLPAHLIPPDATSAPLPSRDSLELLFPEGIAGQSLLPRFSPKVARVDDGVRILSLDALRLSLVREAVGDGVGMRVSRVGGVTLGKDEKVFVDRGLVGELRDPNFEAVWDLQMLDLLVQFRGQSPPSPPTPPPAPPAKTPAQSAADKKDASPPAEEQQQVGLMSDLLARLGVDIEFLAASLSGLPAIAPPAANIPSPMHYMLPAAIALGGGAIAPEDSPNNGAPEYSVFDARATTACHGLLPRAAAEHAVIVVRRGGCTFADKISNVPDAPAIKLLVVEDSDDDGDYGEAALVSPEIDLPQRNYFGRPRRNKLPLVLVSAGEVDWSNVESVGVRRRVSMLVGGVGIDGLEVT